MNGRTIGHYRVLGPLGGGGMGVVYEAEDTRLGRRVALKFLPPDVSRTPAALARFEREARAASALNHPNICTVFDVGEEDGQPFLVMERLSGATLRTTMAGKPLALPAVLELGAQIADALESAHARGIVHRDVKPGNIFVTERGEAKLLDFGIATLASGDVDEIAGDETTPTAAPAPGPEAAPGTVGYMSPEQARGERVDRRSDLFSLGAVLYEMASGKPAFPGRSVAEVFEGILGREPPRLDLVRPAASSLRPIVEKALTKDRALRYQTAGDLRVDLRRARSSLGRDQPPVEPGARQAVRRRAALVAALAAGMLGLALWAGLSRRPAEPPRFTQLTFRRGIVTSARFSADGHTVVYSALWDGRPPEVFSRRLESSQSTSLGLPPATLLSVSSKGDLAILLAPPGERGVLWLGTLARVPLSGGPVRPILEGVFDADWSPDGNDLAVVRWRDGQYQLEYPIGSVILRPSPAARLRVSPRGDRVALLDRAGLVLVDRGGRTHTLALPEAHQRLAWSPGGGSLLVDAGDTDVRRTLRRVDLDGATRTVCALAGTLVVHDVSRDGRVLIHHGLEHWGVRARAPDEPAERDVSVFANAGVAGLSADGRQILLWDGSQGPPGSALLRPTNGGPPLRLGDGHAHGLSDDARWVALETRDQGTPRLAIVPTGPGEVAPLGLARLERPLAAWFVERDAVGLNASATGRPPRAFVATTSSGEVRPVTPEGTTAVPGLLPERRFLARSGSGTLAFFSLAGAREETIGWTLPVDPELEPLRTSGDGRFLYLRRGSVPARVERLDLGSGAAEPWRALAPDDPTGTGHVWSIYLTPDARGYAYTHGLFLQDLYLVDGLM